MIKISNFYLVARDFGTAVACIRRSVSKPLMNCAEKRCQSSKDATSLNESFVDWLVLKKKYGILKLVFSKTKNANQSYYSRHPDNKLQTETYVQAVVVLKSNLTAANLALAS